MSAATGSALRRVIWHDVECGSYAADLPVWRELAGSAPGAVLEAGCGTGRVALDLARAGHEVTGVDSDPALVAELNRRATERGLSARALQGDLVDLSLGPRFGLAIAPMQVIQLLSGREERRVALAGLRAALVPDGRLAVALVDGDPAAGGRASEPPLPDVAEREGWVYSSLPVDVAADGEAITVRRLRQLVSPSGALEEDSDEIRLARLGADELEREAATLGLKPAERLEVPATDAHVASVVAVFEVSP